MSATRTAIKAKEARRVNALPVFVWEGVDKRGTTMKGEQIAKNANMLRAELRRLGIQPKIVKPKPKPLFGAS